MANDVNLVSHQANRSAGGSEMRLTVKSSSGNGDYNVALSCDSGKWVIASVCDCPHNTFKSARCKHIKAAVEWAVAQGRVKGYLKKL